MDARWSYPDEVEDAGDVSTGSSSLDCSVSTGSISMELRIVSRSSRSCWEVSGNRSPADHQAGAVNVEDPQSMVGVGGRHIVGTLRTRPRMTFVPPHGEPSVDAFILGEVGDGQLNLLSVEPVDGDIGRLRWG